MKRLILLGMVICMVAGLSASVLAANGPAIRSIPCALPFCYKQGWWNDTVVWYITTETNNIRFAQSAACQYFPNGGPAPASIVKAGCINDITLAPKLSSALEADATGRVYLSDNASAPAVFSTVPGNDDYTPLWRVYRIVWNNTKATRPVTNADPASDTNPNGIPGIDEAQIIETDIVLNSPIIAVGQLGGPWFPAPEGRYRLPQVLCYNTYYKIVFLPVYVAFCQNRLTRRVELVSYIVPDAGDEELAEKFGANLAPKLMNMPKEDTQVIWTFINPELTPQPNVLEYCPEIGRSTLGDMIALWLKSYIVKPTCVPYLQNPCSWRNTNFDYSPIMCYTELLKVGTKSVITNPPTIRMYLDSGILLKENCGGQRINAPVVCPFVRITSGTNGG